MNTSRSSQRGAYSFLFLVILIAGGLLVFALAADGARLYAQQRILQQHADAAALGAAQGTQACGGEGVTLADICTRAQMSADAAGFEGELDCAGITTGVLETGVDGISRFRVAGLAQSNAVRARLQRSVPRSLLLPGRLVGDLSLAADAVAQKEVVATFSGGGSTAVLGSSTNEASLLGDLLGVILLGPGNSFALNPTDLSSLANTTVALGDLLTELGVNSLAELLPLTGGDLAAALGEVATLGANATAILDAVIANAGVDTIALTDVINVVGDAAVPPNSEFPVYDVLIGLVLNLAEGQLFNLPQTRVSIGGVVTSSIDIFIQGAPAIVIGPARQGQDGQWLTRLEAPDIRLVVNNSIDLGTIPLLIGTLQLGTVDLPLLVDTGAGVGELVAADCSAGLSNDVRFLLESSVSVARIGAGSVDVSGNVSISTINADIGRLVLFPLPLLGSITIDPALGLSTGLDLSIPGASEDFEFSAVLVADPVDKTSANGYFTEQLIPGGADGLDISLQPPPSLTLLGGLPLGLTLDLGPIGNTITGALNPILSEVVQLVVTPLLQSLGVELGGFSATLTDASQDSVRLIRNVEFVD
ncbi:hypothetical protein K8B33_08250 [Alcanivorax sp. JB21]|uniref:hypothetical protein n=1 Tax=Alcanivorax limicola TaxID=2874102 RepID=UPI001CC087D9|nr:hypothetical protein [Alcanivorax limicola]MBZ2189085.1 hypothetical protein [Alcanivorax limicola]